MKQRTFGHDGPPVSEIGIGTWQLGGAEWGDVPEDDALATLNGAADAGVNFIDTADIYGMGRSENLIRTFLESRQDRDRFFVATKLGRNPNPGMPANFQPAVIRQHTIDSIKRLGVERLQLTQTHCIPIEQMAGDDFFRHLRDLKTEGLIERFGASVESVEEGLACLAVEGMASLQVIFNIFRLKPAEELFEKARAKGVAIIVRLPLASGLLAGKYTAETTFPETDHRNFNRNGDYFNAGETFAGLEFERGLAAVEKIRPLVPEGMTMAQFAMRWCLDFDAVTTVIPGARNAEQAAANAAASDLPPLGEDVHEQLRKIYHDDVEPHIRGKY
ncbi:MAG: aldo/keto reductase [Phycisphaeraceae bacterium]|nr:aldo/keto reductase [Phycisphaeraceae bacterium]